MGTHLNIHPAFNLAYVTLLLKTVIFGIHTIIISKHILVFALFLSGIYRCSQRAKQRSWMNFNNENENQNKLYFLNHLWNRALQKALHDQRKSDKKTETD